MKFSKLKNNIDLLATLNRINNETLLKIAMDLEIETPNFIPAIPTFKNEIKSSYINAKDTFEKALSKIEAFNALRLSIFSFQNCI